MPKEYDYSLAGTAMGEFEKCKRCFYDDKHKIAKYRGIFATIMGGLDREMKLHYDAHRQINVLPPELVGKLPDGMKLWGTLADIQPYRKWNSNPHRQLYRAKNGLILQLTGEYDEIFVSPLGVLSIADGKSKGDKPKDSGARYYLPQQDHYHLIAKMKGANVSETGYMIYYYPTKMNFQGLTLGCEVYPIGVDKDRAQDRVERAAECLAGGQPDYNPDCELCAFTQIRVEAALKPIAQAATTQAIANA